jgi:hypothetical protein
VGVLWIYLVEVIRVVDEMLLAAKDHELRQAVKDYESQLVQATQSLAEFKSRALNAEVRRLAAK